MRTTWLCCRPWCHWARDNVRDQIKPRQSSMCKVVYICTSLSWKIIKLNIIKSSEQCTEFLTNLNRETNRPQDKVPQQSPTAFSVPCSHLQARRTSPQSPNTFESFFGCLFLSIACCQRTHAEGMCRFTLWHGVSIAWIWSHSQLSFARSLCSKDTHPTECWHLDVRTSSALGNGQCFTPGLTRYITVCICTYAS